MEAFEEVGFRTGKYDVVSISQLVCLDEPDILVKRAAAHL
jgi:hypothetical protein